MNQVKFGDVLYEARVHKGYDLTAAARRLRIRPDILQAIESSDFSRMPPRGYSRNMVNAYARYLGLNPSEITKMYLDEAYAFQVGATRKNATSTGFDMSAAQSKRTAHQTERLAAQQRMQNSTPAHQGRFSRKMYSSQPDNPTQGTDSSRLYSDSQTHRSRGSVLPPEQYTNLYSGPEAPSPLKQRMPFIIAAAVIIILIIVIISLVSGGKGSSEEEAVPNVPVTGVQDKTAETTSTPAVETAPTSFKFKYEVASGASAWIEVWVDNEVKVADTITGPNSGEYDITGTVNFICSNMDGVKVYQDGTELSLTPSSDGIVNTSITFASVLDAWYTAHPSVARPATTPATTATPATTPEPTATTTTQSDTSTLDDDTTYSDTTSTYTDETYDDTAYTDQSDYYEGYDTEQYYDESYSDTSGGELLE